MSGLASVTGWKETGPIQVGVATGDSLAGIFAAYGIALALLERKNSGKGQRIEISLLEGLVAVLGFQAAKYFGSDERPKRLGNDHGMVALYGGFKTEDGYMKIAASNQAMWMRLAKTMGLAHLTTDERFLTVADRVKNCAKLARLLEEKLKERTNKEWEDLLNEAGAGNGPILHIDEVFQDPKSSPKKMLLEMDHPKVGRIRTLEFPVKPCRTPAQLKIPPAYLGQHTDRWGSSRGYGGYSHYNGRRERKDF
jgi:crotonobetainyl-CoA:carnitine CoA-transferase CaiB-like acyl-CoA transferase